MRTVWVASVALTGCFYVDPINERPGADIVQVSPELAFRGDRISVRAEIYDPDGDQPFADWRAYACHGDECDVTPFDTDNLFTFSFDAEPTLDDGRPTTRIHVTLEVQDALGARATPVQDVDILLDNHAPLIDEPQLAGLEYRDQFPIGTPVVITAIANDEDDAPETLVWDEPVLYPAPDATPEDATLTRLADDAPGVARWELLTDVAGQWTVELTVRDPIGATDMRTRAIPVQVDLPPCIVTADPDFPPEGSAIVVDAPRLFSVLAVDDDLDVYPAPSPGGLRDVVAFRWFLDGAPLGVDGNSFEIDPRAFTPDTEHELRVEAVDRVDRPLCDASLPECSLMAGCDTRRSWRFKAL